MNTKAHHRAILAAAARALAQAGGHHALDDLAQAEKQAAIRNLAKAVVAATGCHYDSAKRNVVKAIRIDRGQLIPRWGGARPGSGRPGSGRPTE